MTFYGYTRVSSTEQSLNYSLESQSDTLKTWGVPADKIHREIASATNMDRPILKNLLETLQPGDTLVVTTLDRFSRSMVSTLLEISLLHKRRILFVALDVPGGGSFDQPTAVLLTSVFSFLAEQELNSRKEKQRLGIAKAKADGKYLGRKSLITDKLVKAAGHYYYGCNLRGEALARVLNCSKNTALKALREYNRINSK